MPEARFEIVAVAPLLLQAKVKGEEPLEGLIVAEPLLLPQLVLTDEVVAARGLEPETLVLAVAEHPPKPVTVTV